jgi:rubrerythrin
MEACRRAEKEQAIFYRKLAAMAEAAEQPELAARFHDLHADEQHHLSRLTARLIELGEHPADLGDVRMAEAEMPGWEAAARTREEEEVRRYEHFLAIAVDPATRALVDEILGVERIHATELAGKWTMA